MKESQLVLLVERELRKFFPRIYLNKNHGDQFQQRGRPDLEGNIMGLHFGFELKTQSRFHGLQVSHLKRIEAAGGLAGGIVHVKSKTFFLNAHQCDDYSLRKLDEYLTIGDDKSLDFSFIYWRLHGFFNYFHES